jgi:hypothetical protein
MADNNSKYPMLASSCWWALRKRFQQSISPSVTDSYLSSILNIQRASAKTNIIPYLIQMGIIDNEGKTLERANLWRNDDLYPQVCNDILNEIYPDEILHIASGEIDRRAITNWFSTKTGAGSSAVAKMVSLFLLLVKADPSEQSEKKPSITNKVEKPKQQKKEIVKKEADTKGEILMSPKSDTLIPSAFIPSINLNLQIHISADATLDQIDQIFASMAKHLCSK